MSQTIMKMIVDVANKADDITLSEFENNFGLILDNLEIQNPMKS